MTETRKSDLPPIIIKLLASIAIIVILGLVTAFGYLVFQVAKAIPDTLVNLNPSVLAALIAASGTVLATVLAHLVERYIAKSRDIREAHRQYKTELYRSFFESIVGHMQSAVKEKGKAKKAQYQRELVVFLQKFIRDLILWASPTVISGFKRMIKKASENPMEAMVLMDDLMREIRKDLGHSNRGLARGDLWKLFLRDPEAMDEIMTSMND